MTIQYDKQRNELVIRVAVNPDPPLSSTLKTRLVASEHQTIQLEGHAAPVRVQVNATVKVPKLPS